MLEYLCAWRWAGTGLVKTASGVFFRIEALPMLVDDAGEIEAVGKYEQDAAVVASDSDAFSYLMRLAKRDLQYRGMRDDRLSCFQHKQDANFLLYRRVRQCQDAAEYECLRQSWDVLNRPKYRDLK